MLDEERRDAFLAALQSLEDEREEAAQREQDLAREKEEKLQADLEEARRRRIESEEREAKRLEEQRSARAGSEVDYGVDSSHPVQSNGSANGKTAHSNGSASGKSSPSKSAAAPKKGAIKSRVVHSTRPSGSGQRVVTPPNMIQRATALMGNVQKLIKVLAATLLNNPGSVLRTLAFAVLILLALGNRAVKDRLRGMWGKVRGTMGMATKVSYI